MPFGDFLRNNKFTIIGTCLGIKIPTLIGSSIILATNLAANGTTQAMIPIGVMAGTISGFIAGYIADNRQSRQRARARADARAEESRDTSTPTPTAPTTPTTPTKSKYEEQISLPGCSSHSTSAPLDKSFLSPIQSVMPRRIPAAAATLDQDFNQPSTSTSTTPRISGPD